MACTNPTLSAGFPFSPLPTPQKTGNCFLRCAGAGLPDPLETSILLWGLDKPKGQATIPPTSGNFAARSARTGVPPGSMNPIPPSPREKKSNMATCKHPRVQIVAREEDSEFVECMECGDIFESSEFKDMT